METILVSGERGRSERGPTWTHVKGRSAAVVLRYGILGCKAKIRKQNIVSIVGYQNIFRLEIPMEDPQTVAMLHGIQDLEECSADEKIIVHIPTSLRNVGKEVTFWTILQNNVNALWVVHNF
jgi:hypothetical protein